MTGVAFYEAVTCLTEIGECMVTTVFSRRVSDDGDSPAGHFTLFIKHVMSPNKSRHLWLLIVAHIHLGVLSDIIADRSIT